MGRIVVVFLMVCFGTQANAANSFLQKMIQSPIIQRLSGIAEFPNIRAGLEGAPLRGPSILDTDLAVLSVIEREWPENITLQQECFFEDIAILPFSEASGRALYALEGGNAASMKRVIENKLIGDVFNTSYPDAAYRLLTQYNKKCQKRRHQWGREVAANIFTAISSVQQSIHYGVMTEIEGKELVENIRLIHFPIYHQHSIYFEDVACARKVALSTISTFENAKDQRAIDLSAASFMKTIFWRLFVIDRDLRIRARSLQDKDIFEIVLKSDDFVVRNMVGKIMNRDKILVKNTNFIFLDPLTRVDEDTLMPLSEYDPDFRKRLGEVA